MRIWAGLTRGKELSLQGLLGAGQAPSTLNPAYMAAVLVVTKASLSLHGYVTHKKKHPPRALP